MLVFFLLFLPIAASMADLSLYFPSFCCVDILLDPYLFLSSVEGCTDLDLPLTMCFCVIRVFIYNLNRMISLLFV
jgi:hypothetical protein